MSVRDQQYSHIYNVLCMYLNPCIILYFDVLIFLQSTLYDKNTSAICYCDLLKELNDNLHTTPTVNFAVKTCESSSFDRL